MKTETKFINICNIKVDRYPLNPSTLSLIHFLEENGIEELPPIRVRLESNGQYMIKDGRHRVTAFKLLGIKQILAKVSREYKRGN